MAAFHINVLCFVDVSTRGRFFVTPEEKKTVEAPHLRDRDKKTTARI